MSQAMNDQPKDKLSDDDGHDSQEGGCPEESTEAYESTPSEDSSTSQQESARPEPADFMTKLRISELERKVSDYESKISGIRDYVKNLENEMEAARGRAQRDQERLVDLKVSQALREWLPIVDNLERSVKAAAGDQSALAEGIRLVSAQFQDSLRRQGLEKIETKGEIFNPEIHEALTMVPVNDSAQDQIVVEEVQSGYRYKGMLLRPAQVVVGKAIHS